MKPVWEDLLNEGYDVRLADVDKYEYWRKKTDKIPATFFVTKKRVLGSFVGVQTKDQLKLQYKKIVDGR
jgi:hypothetical protein